MDPTSSLRGQFLVVVLESPVFSWADCLPPPHPGGGEVRNRGQQKGLERSHGLLWQEAGPCLAVPLDLQPDWKALLFQSRPLWATARPWILGAHSTFAKAPSSLRIHIVPLAALGRELGERLASEVAEVGCIQA